MQNSPSECFPSRTLVWRLRTLKEPSPLACSSGSKSTCRLRLKKIKTSVVKSSTLITLDWMKGFDWFVELVAMETRSVLDEALHMRDSLIHPSNVYFTVFTISLMWLFTSISCLSLSLTSVPLSLSFFHSLSIIVSLSPTSICLSISFSLSLSVCLSPSVTVFLHLSLYHLSFSCVC